MESKVGGAKTDNEDDVLRYLFKKQVQLDQSFLILLGFLLYNCFRV